MTDERDLDDMFLSHHNEQAERILSGAADPDDLGGGLAEVATLLRAAQGPATHDEFGSVDMADIAERVRSSSVVRFDSRVAHRFRARTAALVLAGTVFTAGAAAAATGTLPGPLQRTLSRVYADVAGDMSEVHSTSATTLPLEHESTTAEATGDTKENSSSSTTGGTTVTSTGGTTVTTTATTPANSNAVGPDVTGPAQAGLCNGYEASTKGKNMDAVAFRNLTDAATAAGQTIDEFCAAATPGRSGSAGSSTSTSVTRGPTTTAATTSTTAKGHGKP